MALKEQWRRLETRRHFLGRMGKTLGWAGLGLSVPLAIGVGAVLLGGALVTALVLLAMALLIGRTRTSVQRQPLAEKTD